MSFGTGADGEVFTMSGGVPTWKPNSGTGVVGIGSISSIFGRTGSIVAQIGDYTTDLIAE